MAIATVSKNSKVKRDPLATIRESVQGMTSAWNLSAPSSVNSSKPKGNDWDSIESSAEAVFNKAAASSVTGAYTGINLSHTRGSELDSSDINVLGGTASGSGNRLTWGLATYITTLSPSCSQGCGQPAPCGQGCSEGCSEGCGESTPCGEGCGESTPCGEPCGDCSCSEGCSESCGYSCSQSCSESCSDCS